MNPERIYVHPDFKRNLKIAAACKGKDIVGYTKDLVEERVEIESIMKDWNKKIKENKRSNGFDFV